MTSVLQVRKKESYKIFDEIAKTYDFLNHFLSLGIDIYWRKKFIKDLPNIQNIKALDLATGTGDVPLVLIKDSKVDTVKGVDLSKEMMAIGKVKVANKGLSDKIDFQVGDGVSIPCNDTSFDLVTISFGIRNFSDPSKSLRDIMRVLKPGGRCMIMELSIPKSQIIKFIYITYFRKVLPFLGNLLSRHKDAYSYLNQTVEDFPYGQEFEDLMIDAGFKNTRRQTLTFGIATLYIGDKN